jgi:putative transposase
MHEIFNGILYVLRSGCSWRMLPHDLPPWGTVHYYYRRFRRDGTLLTVHELLRAKVRRAAGRLAQPSAAILEASVGQDDQKRGTQARLRWGQESQRPQAPPAGGYPGADPGGVGPCGRRGRARGRPLVVGRRVSGPAGRSRLVRPLAAHLWVDAGYNAKEWLGWVETALGWTVEVVRKPRRWGWYPEGVTPPPMPAFTVLKRRWVVERTFAWLDGYRRLSKDYEYLPESSEAMIRLAMINLMIHRLKPG